MQQRSTTYNPVLAVLYVIGLAILTTIGLVLGFVFLSLFFVVGAIFAAYLWFQRWRLGERSADPDRSQSGQSFIEGEYRVVDPKHESNDGSDPR